MLDDDAALAKAQARAEARKMHASLEAIVQSLEEIAAVDEEREDGERRITEADFKAQEAEDEAQQLYEMRCAERTKAENDWVDAVVAEQEANALRKATSKQYSRRERTDAAGVNDDDEWAAALAPFGLRLTRNEVSGRGLVADRAFAPGDVLMSAPAASAVLLADCASTHCHHCHVAALGSSAAAPPVSLKVCSACKYARYCCAAHQRAAWPAHKSECKMLQHTKPRVPGPSILLLARLLDSGCAAVGSDGGEGYEGGVGGKVAEGAMEAPQEAAQVASSGKANGAASVRGVRSLGSNLSTLEPPRRAELAAQSAMLLSLLGEALPDRWSSPGADTKRRRPSSHGATPALLPSADAAHQLLAVVSSNGHTMCDDELQPVGLGLFPLAALTNHDCEPSACQSFVVSGEGGGGGGGQGGGGGGGGGSDGAPRLVLRALRRLRPGDPITIGYIDLSQTVTRRRSELQRAYGFRCVCSRCEREAQAAEADARDSEKRAAQLASCRNATLACLDSQDWSGALTLAARCCQLCESLSPAGAPAIGIERLRYAKLLAHHGELREAIVSWRHAYAVLSVAHGRSAPLVKSILNELAQAEAELQMAVAQTADEDDDGAGKLTWTGPPDQAKSQSAADRATAGSVAPPYSASEEID